MQISHTRTAFGLAVGLALVPALAAAQVIIPTSQSAAAASATTTTAPASTTKPVAIGKAGQAAQARADKEIDRRITSLNALLTRVNSLSRMSDAFKQALASNVNNQIQLLQTLKAKIDADTDLATLKTDVKSITDDYRIYRLVIPQGHISAMADRVVNITVMMQAVGTKLQARIQAAAAAGNDTTAATKALTDLATQLTAAQTQAKAAMDAILPLKPDQGDKATQDANDAAMKTARKDLQAAQQALVAGRKDITAIVKFLATAKSGTATSTPATASSSQAH